ncbi:hypothetical protein PIROE2DRAFT_7913 [Piromyces sp. E2]|nr:hypothetical protein PIROE2DRAFT_7913 [Piromyces sp. E2]|eukprot:OUM65109.1 hypothetical protein PIROE2DRAFT_7913 [Piromyces sp. E2]
MTKKEVLNIKVSKYDSHDKCPEYSEKDSYPNDCSFTFYCIDDNNCQSDNNSTSPYFYFIDKDNTTKAYIKEFCYEKNENTDNYYNYNEDCTTVKCNSNSDCLSNNCKNNTYYAGQSLFTEFCNIKYADFILRTSQNEINIFDEQK